MFAQEKYAVNMEWYDIFAPARKAATYENNIYKAGSAPPPRMNRMICYDFLARLALIYQ